MPSWDNKLGAYNKKVLFLIHAACSSWNPDGWSSHCLQLCLPLWWRKKNSRQSGTNNELFLPGISFGSDIISAPTYWPELVSRSHPTSKRTKSISLPCSWRAGEHGNVWQTALMIPRVDAFHKIDWLSYFLNSLFYQLFWHSEKCIINSKTWQ